MHKSQIGSAKGQLGCHYSSCWCVTLCLSRTSCAMQNTGLTRLTLSTSSPSRLSPATPNRVWNGSATSPGLSANPPVSLSCK